MLYTHLDPNCIKISKVEPNESKTETQVLKSRSEKGVTGLRRRNRIQNHNFRKALGQIIPEIEITDNYEEYQKYQQYA